MATAFNSSPRFSQEVFDLILENVGEHINARWPNYPNLLHRPDYRTMTMCARVSKA